MFERLDSISLSQSKYLVTSFVDFLIYRQSFASLLTCCWLLLQNVQDLMDNAYLRMINMERDQKHSRTYKSFLFEAIQDISSIYKSLTNT